jgi:hypothetical protein
MQADSSGGVTVPAQQQGPSKKRDADKPCASAYTSLNDLRRIFDLPPIALPSTMPDENDPTNDFEAVSSMTCWHSPANFKVLKRLGDSTQAVFFFAILMCHHTHPTCIDVRADEFQGLLSRSRVLTGIVSGGRPAC